MQAGHLNSYVMPIRQESRNEAVQEQLVRNLSLVSTTLQANLDLPGLSIVLDSGFDVLLGQELG